MGNEKKMENEKEYISYMRKIIGHKKMISVGLAAVLIDKEGKILLEKRTDNGKYCLPGGSINFDETVTEGLIREVYEETGIKIENPNLFMILSGKKEEFIYPNGDVTDYVDLIFYTYLKEGQDVRMDHDDESSEIRFYSLDHLPEKEEFLRGTLAPIEKIKNKDFSLTVD